MAYGIAKLNKLLFGRLCNKFITHGVPDKAEIIPFEPDPGNAGVGSGDHCNPIEAISFSGERVWLFILWVTNASKHCHCQRRAPGESGLFPEENGSNEQPHVDRL